MAKEAPVPSGKKSKDDSSKPVEPKIKFRVWTLIVALLQIICAILLFLYVLGEAIAIHFQGTMYGSILLGLEIGILRKRSQYNMTLQAVDKTFGISELETARQELDLLVDSVWIAASVAFVYLFIQLCAAAALLEASKSEITLKRRLKRIRFWTIAHVLLFLVDVLIPLPVGASFLIGRLAFLLIVNEYKTHVKIADMEQSDIEFNKFTHASSPKAQ